MKLKRPKSEANWSLHSTGLRLPGRPGTRLPDVGGGGRSDLGHAPLDVHRLAARPQRVRQRRNWAPRAPPPFATFRHIPDRGPRRSNEQLESYGVDLASVIPNDDADGIKDRAGVRELQLAFWRTRRRGVQEWSDLSSACPEARCVSCGSELQFRGAAALVARCPSTSTVQAPTPGPTTSSQRPRSARTASGGASAAGAAGAGAFTLPQSPFFSGPLTSLLPFRSPKGGRLRPRRLPVLPLGQAQRPGAAQHGAGDRRLHPEPEAPLNRYTRWTHVAPAL